MIFSHQVITAILAAMTSATHTDASIPACTAEVFFGQGTGQSPKDIGSTFLSSSEDWPDDINIIKNVG